MAILSKRKVASPSVQQILDHGVSQSELMMFLECQQKLKLSQDGIAPRTVSTPLVYGDIGHKCLWELYTQMHAGVCLYGEGISEVVDHVVNHHREQHHEYNENQLQTLEHWNVQLRVTLAEYFDFWGDKETEWNWVGLERSIPRIQIHDTYLEGQLDGVFSLPKSKYGFLDHKFKGQISDETLLETLETDFQLMVYALSIRQEFGVLPSYALYNCIRRPSLRLTKKETLLQHEKRLGEHIRKDPTHYFKRYEVPFDHTMLDTFENELHDIVSDYIQWVRLGRLSRKYGNPCNGRYGVCGMYGHCHRDDKVNYKNIGLGGYRPF